MSTTYFDWLRSLSKEEMAEYLSKHFSCSNCLGNNKQNWLKKLSENMPMPMPKLEVGDVIFTNYASYVYLGADVFITDVIEDVDNCENIALVDRNGLSGEILSIKRRLGSGGKALITIWER